MLLSSRPGKEREERGEAAVWRGNGNACQRKKEGMEAATEGKKSHTLTWREGEEAMKVTFTMADSAGLQVEALCTKTGAIYSATASDRL